MVHAPLRGLFALTRLGLIVAAAAAIPILLKRSKPAAGRVGDALIELGNKLKGDGASAAPATESKEPVAEAKTEPKRAASKPPSSVKQAKPKPAAARDASARRKPPKQPQA
jgi:outer membrane biosynthesis protein TonB